MTGIIKTTFTAVTAFVATNLDDILILTILFTQAGKLLRRRHIVIGQYLGFGLLVAASLTGFFGSLFMSPQWIRYLGLVPVILGILAIVKPQEEEKNPEMDLEAAQGFPANRWLSPQTSGVAALTVANGSDNIGVYVPLFAGSSWLNLLITVGVFFLLVGVWCLVAYKLTSLPAISTLVTSRGSTFVPCVLIGLGVFIVKESIPLAIFALALSYLWVVSSGNKNSKSI
ncbi:MAG: hypothetical protein N5P05_001809 [Chroococcopsis gigantea SAG 12.99]|jgi:cadmium resistance transport/sequestration family protein|nr:hypothetical protein [Chroococcopsis gigantea SAG 12.99]